MKAMEKQWDAVATAEGLFNPGDYQTGFRKGEGTSTNVAMTLNLITN